jgi:D-beta-D-heptose 7-phosphate kinase/D-beta-D-heptose 1-phosphate adenosyltransferase
MDSKIKSEQEVIQIIRDNPCTLITGSFDIVHLGHMRFISQAKAIDPKNLLIVVVLSDQTIRARKGEGRPLFKQSERVELLTYHKDIDYVLPWKKDWQELRDFVVDSRPKLLVVNSTDSGIDNKRQTIESVGGKLAVLERKDDYSTSKIIERLKSK